MKKLVAMILSGIMAIGFITGCSKSEETSANADGDSKVLVMGTSADYKPFEFIDTAVSDEIIGFDVDLANYIADQLGYELKIQDMDFNSLITALKTDKVDIVLAGMTATDDRRKSVDFSDVYYSAKNVIITTKDNKFTSVEDLNGKTLGAQTGTTQQTAVEDLQKSGVDVALETRERVPDLIQELLSGRFDGVVLEDMITEPYLEKNTNLQTVDIIDNGDQGSAIALKKGSELTEKVNGVLAEMKQNGKMDELLEKWFTE